MYYTALRYTTLHYITLHWVTYTLHYYTFHYIKLYYFALCCISCSDSALCKYVQHHKIVVMPRYITLLVINSSKQQKEDTTFNIGSSVINSSDTFEIFAFCRTLNWRWYTTSTRWLLPLETPTTTTSSRRPSYNAASRLSVYHFETRLRQRDACRITENVHWSRFNVFSARRFDLLRV